MGQTLFLHTLEMFLMFQDGVNPFVYSLTKLLQSYLVKLSDVFKFEDRRTVLIIIHIFQECH